MTERPIIMSTPMVKAILDGRKVQTRRIIKPQPPEHNATPSIVCNNVWMSHDRRGKGTTHRCPYGNAGSGLWVRETFCYESDSGLSDGRMFYKASDSPDEIIKWRPSIFMPRWASRIDLEITGVRVERLTEISEDDAEKEGASWSPVGSGENPEIISAVENFANLWDTLNAKRGYGWSASPWVWVIEFKMVTK